MLVPLGRIKKDKVGNDLPLDGFNYGFAVWNCRLSLESLSLQILKVIINAFSCPLKKDFQCLLRTLLNIIWIILIFSLYVLVF